MPARANLVALAAELRHARTRLLPLAIAERIQHAIVRIEQMLAWSFVGPEAAEAISRDARKLLDECEVLRGKV